MRVIVRGDHPIFKRPDKVFTDDELAKEYAGELIHAGYENVCIEPLPLGEIQKAILKDIENFRKANNEKETS